MMKRSLNRQDIEALSAYLDGQLPGRERRKLEARLRQEPDLKQAYEDLRLTRAVLRRAPKIQRRRNFTLTPEMLRMGSRTRGFAAMRLVSVVASVLFGILVAGELFIGSIAMGDADVAFAPMAAEEKSMSGNVAADEALEYEMTEAPEEPAPAEAVVEEPAVMPDEDTADSAAEPDAEEGDAGDEATAEEDLGPSGGGGVAPTATLAAQPTPTLWPTLVPPGADRLPEATATPLPTLPEGKGEETPLAMQTSPEETSLQDDRAADGEEQIGGDTPTGVEDTGEAAPQAEEWGRDVPVIRWVEGGLIVVALLSGVVAWVLSRRGR